MRLCDIGTFCRKSGVLVEMAGEVVAVTNFCSVSVGLCILLDLWVGGARVVA